MYEKITAAELKRGLELFISNVKDATIGRMNARDLVNEALYTLRDDGIGGVTPLIRQKTRRVEVSLTPRPNVSLEDVENALDDLVDIAGYAGLCAALLQHLREVKMEGGDGK